MSLTRNFLPLVIAVGAGVGISVYTLKPELEEQQRLRTLQQQLKTDPLAVPKTPEQSIPNKTIEPTNTDTTNSTRNI